MAAAENRKTRPTRAPKRAKALTPREKMRAHRARMRAKGFKLVQVWVPDTSNPAFRAQIRRDVRQVRDSKGEREAIAWLDAALMTADEWT